MELDEIAEKIRKCDRCSLYKNRRNAVPGEGNENAKIMFIGEAPGRNEDSSGRPFVGRAGMLLNEMLEKAGFRREDVYITNVVKCRPPNNRDPEPIEIETCTKLYLDVQISAIKPKVIAGLGRHASKHLFDKFGLEFPGIGKAHGNAYKVDNLFNNFVLFPMYHPAAAIYNQNLKGMLERDFEKLAAVFNSEV